MRYRSFMILDCRLSRVAALFVAILLTLSPTLLLAAPLAQDTPVAASTPSPAAAVPPAVGPDAVTGQSSYTQNCAPCHGTTGAGDGPSAAGLGVPPATLGKYETVAGMSLNDLFLVAKNGRMDRMMPPWGTRLTDQEIWDTIAYAWSLHTSPDEVAAGKTVYDANCASCHGPDGKGKPPLVDLTSFPATAGTSQNSWAQVVSAGRGEMPGFGDKLNAADQRAVLEYVRSLSFTKLFRGPLAKGTGVISGTVTNGTTNQPMPNLKVELGIFDGTTSLESRTGTTDATGFYRFSELPTDTNLVYMARVEYPAGFPYGSDIGSFKDGATDLNLPVSVYETTTDGSGVHADQVHFIVEFDPGQDGTTQPKAMVAELVVFSLDGNRAYIGDGTAVLRFSLPTGAQELDVSDGQLGQRYIATQDGFVDTLALPPGQGVRQVLYRYSLPYSGRTLDLSRSLPFAVANVNALISDQGEKVSSVGLADKGPRQTQNGNYFTFSGENVPAGQQITLHFTNLPAAGAGAALAPATSDRILLYVLVALAGAGAVLLATLPILRARARARGAEVLVAAGPISRQDLVDSLARLDIAYQAGQLAEASYREQRLRLKAQLQDLLRKESAG